MVTSKIKQRIIGKGRGAIFAPSDFLDIGSRASVDQALLSKQSRHVLAWMHPVAQRTVAHG